jgi:TRAP-type C4-dicarboxylate transport system permease large subunit
MWAGWTVATRFLLTGTRLATADIVAVGFLTAACAMFAAISRSSPTTAAAMGCIAVPIVAAPDYNLTWVGILLAKLLEVAMITPRSG